MIAVAAAVGYLLGSLPTAVTLGRVWGVDLRGDGSRNPGANNALRLGGPVLGATVLLIEMSKGLAAVTVGISLAGDPGAVTGAIAAVAGNVYNIWHGLDGGKGLAISGGVLLGAAPWLLVPALAVLVLVALPTRSSGDATLVALITLDLSAVIWWMFGWPVGWGLATGHLLVILAAGMSATLWSRHRADAIFIGQRHRRRSGPGSPARR